MKRLLVVLLVLAFVTPAIAAEWNMYGHARMNVGSYNRSKEFAGDTDDDSDLEWNLQGNSRIGANVKASDAISGRFEFGVSSSDVGSRLIYGTWNFGPGFLRVGQDYTPITQLLSGAIGAVDLGGDDNLLNCGMTYEGRLPQVKLNVMGFELALIQPKEDAAHAGGADDFYMGTGSYYDGDDFDGDFDTTMPKIEVAYTFATDMFSVKPYLGLNNITINETGEEDNDSLDISSQVFGLAGKVKFGPAYVHANVYKAVNPGNYGLVSLADRKIGFGNFAVNADDDVVDSDQLGGAIVVGFKASDMIKIEAGYGMINDEIEDDGIKVETSMNTMYIQAVITVAPGFYVIPEYGNVDLGELKVTDEDDEELGDVNYIAAKLQINF